LIAGAIGESGSFMGLRTLPSLQDAEKVGVNFAKQIDKNSLSDLRAMTADELLNSTAKMQYGSFPADVDGYFFPKSPTEIFEKGEQAHVPLLVGWNSAEVGYQMILGSEAPTVENYTNAVKKLYGAQADEALKVYHASDDADVAQVATALASDRFIAFNTWKWSDLQSKTGMKPVYRYWYTRPRPEMRAEMGNAVANLAGGVSKDTTGKKVAPAAPPLGAVHSSEIEYAMGNLPTNLVYNWQPEDYEVSLIMQNFFANFIKTGNPNGLGVPEWPKIDNHKGVEVMHIGVETKAFPEQHHDRYAFMDKLSKK